MQQTDPAAKAIVFSQFVNMLDVRIFEMREFLLYLTKRWPSG